MNKALFLDLDGTIRKTKSGGPCPNMPEDIEILPNVREILHKYVDKGFLLLGVTNQGGVELGHVTEEQVNKCIHETNDLVGGLFTAIAFCPALKSPNRKPAPGMIFDLAKDHDVCLEKSIMVGDMHTDLMCATIAGIGHFFFAKDFFGPNMV